MSDQQEQDKINSKPKESKSSAPEWQMPKMTFTTFVLSLNSSALVNLGAETDPITKTTSVNLPVAKQTIDILAMLEEKTRGNLTHDESRLLTHFLYELRIMYVKKRDEK